MASFPRACAASGAGHDLEIQPPASSRLREGPPVSVKGAQTLPFQQTVIASVFAPIGSNPAANQRVVASSGSMHTPWEYRSWRAIARG